MDKPLLILLALLIPALPSFGRTIEFSGITWEVRNGTGAPGNGCWSDGEQSVWVDDEGALHLRIRKVRGTWCQAEVRALTTLRHGDYTFFVRSRLDQLDPNIVLGMFLYDPDGELDIEITGSFGSGAQRGWFTIFGHGGRKVAQESFDVVLNGTYTTHSLRWLPDRVDFRSWHGHCDAPPCGGIIHDWTYDGPERPAPSIGLQPRINLWVQKNSTVKREQEVIISSYRENLITERRRPVRRH